MFAVFSDGQFMGEFDKFSQAMHKLVCCKGNEKHILTLNGAQKQDLVYLHKKGR